MWQFVLRTCARNEASSHVRVRPLERVGGQLGEWTAKLVPDVAEMRHRVVEVVRTSRVSKTNLVQVVNYFFCHCEHVLVDHHILLVRETNSTVEEGECHVDALLPVLLPWEAWKYNWQMEQAVLPPLVGLPAGVVVLTGTSWKVSWVSDVSVKAIEMYIYVIVSQK